MKPVQHTLRRLNTALDTYQEVLNTISAVDFARKPASGGWGRSEVFWHILDASLLSLEAAVACAEGHGKHKPTPFVSRLILFFGSLPPGKYKMPAVLAERSRTCAPAEAQALMDKLRTMLNTSGMLLEAADPSLKVKHPRLGYLNAPQWLRFTWIHAKHHLKQLRRISETFSNEDDSRKNL